MMPSWFTTGWWIGLIGWSICSIGSLICFIVVLVKLFDAKGAACGFLGMIVSPYTFIWGWVESRRLGITNIMCLWTLLFGVTFALSVTAFKFVSPRFFGRSQRAKVTMAQSEILSFEIALDSFEIDTGFYPQGSAGLNALVEQPNNGQNWKGPYLAKGIPLDPWGGAYIYNYPGKNNPKGYDLSSVGSDGRSGTDDDITNWDTKK